MNLASCETLIFTAEEKKEIDLALNNVLDDLEALWSISLTESICQCYGLTDYVWRRDTRELTIEKEGIKISYPEEIILEKFGIENRRPKITEYTEMFYFLKQYEEIRKGLEQQIEKTRRKIDKEEIGMIKNILQSGLTQSQSPRIDPSLTAMIVFYAMKGLEVPYMRQSMGANFNNNKETIVEFVLQSIQF